MKIAVTVWNNRIAPVFESAGNCALIELSDGKVTQKELFTLPKDSIREKAEIFRSKEVTILVCGAISGESETMLIQRGVEVFSFIAGEFPDVLDGLKNESLFSRRFSMPGCGCPKRRCGRRHRFGHNDK
jgi:predicted Fe-Mo cluster-binding NifX family protein